MFSLRNFKAVNLQDVVEAMVRGSAWVATVCTFLMMMLVTADVIGTKIFSKPIPGTLEITEELMAVLVILGLALTQVERGHLRVSVLLTRFSQKWRDRLDFFGYYLFGTIIVSVLGWRSLVLIKTYIVSGSVKMGWISFPLWPTAVVLSLGFLIFGFLLLFTVINKRHLIKRRVQSTEG